MDFSHTEDHVALREGIAAIMHKFDADYWLQRDDDGKFPVELMIWKT